MTARVCEVCGAGTDQETSGQAPRLRRVVLEDRVVALCPEHHEALERDDIRTLAELYAAFRETEGRRAVVQRRSPVDRRVFPPRPEGRRRSDGRRRDDDE